MKVTILGTDYQVKVSSAAENPKLEDANGISELWSHEIILNLDDMDSPNAFDNVKDFYHKVLRHEVIHCMFHEMGLSQYCQDEVLVDALAIVFPKIQPVLNAVDCMRIEKENEECYGKETKKNT